jgi:ubiquinone/menaquinone biosynthesis C-methylase UbiE
MMDFSAYQDGSVKFGICRDSLSYIGNDHLFFANLKRILKEGGYFWCKDVSIKYYEEMAQKPFVVVLKKNILAWPLYKATGLRLLAFIGSDPNRLKYIFKKLGFKVVYLKEEGA